MITLHDYSTTPIASSEIANLFKISFNQEMDEQYWHWRFENNPMSSKIYIVYATHKDKLVAYYAVSPVEMIDQKENTVKVALSNMTMTHPDYQGKGLFKSLATKLFDGLKADGFEGVFGFANSNSHYGFRKNLGWTDITALNVFSLSKGCFREFLLRNPIELFFSIQETKNFDSSKIDSLIRSSSDKLRTSFSSSVYDWRFNQIPNKQYKYLEAKSGNQMIGHLVFKEYGDDLDLMEYWYGDNSEITKNDLLPYLIQYLTSQYSGDINFWSNLHDTEHLVLEKFGFQEKEFNSYFGFISLGTNKDFLEMKNWHYRFTDSDIF